MNMEKMSANEYQYLTRRTAGVHKDPAIGLVNWSMGLAGEVGEVVDYLKKVVFHGHPLDKEKLTKELGDALWYLARIADDCKIPLDVVMYENIEKLRKRYPEGFSTERSVNRVED